MLTLLSLVQFLALKISEMDYFLKALLTQSGTCSFSRSLTYTRSHNLKSTYENTDEMLMIQVYLRTFILCVY